MENDEATSLYVIDGELVVPTDLCRSPWDHGFLHGGAVTGIIGRSLDRCVAKSELAMTRMTVEILTLVPCAPLQLRTEIIKPGRRSVLVGVELVHDGRLVARGTGHFGIHRTDTPLPPPDDSIPALPEVAADPGASEVDYPRPGFNCDAVELRPIFGTTEDAGPGLIWIRLRHSLMAGEANSPLVAVSTISDMSIAVGWEPSPADRAMINTDVTLQLNRYPADAWMLVDSRFHTTASGLGFCEATLSDRHGSFGRILQSVIEAPEALQNAMMDPK